MLGAIFGDIADYKWLHNGRVYIDKDGKTYNFGGGRRWKYSNAVFKLVTITPVMESYP